MSNVVASRAHGHFFFSELVALEESQTLGQMANMVDDVDNVPPGSKENLPDVFQLKDRAVFYPESLEMYSRHSCRGALLNSSVLERIIQL